MARDHYTKVYLKHHPSPDLTIPGPGSYNPLPVIGREGKKFSLQGKFKNLSKIDN